MITKDDTSTPITDESSPNEFERDKPGTSARTDAEGAIEELRQRGGVFVNAVRATRMPMALTDPNLPGNPIVFANGAFLKLTGYSMDEVLGQQPHFMNGPGTDPKDARRFEEAIRSDQDDIIETVQYRKGGGRFVATVLISAFKDEQGRVLNHFMSWLDVTRRVEAEEEVADLRRAQLQLRERDAALRESESKYRSLFEAMDEGYLLAEVITDEASGLTDIRYLEANPAALRIAGRDFTGRRMRDLDPDYEEFWYELYARVASTGEPARGEHFAAPHGRWFSYYVFRVGDDESPHVASVFRDITERKAEERLLREGEERQSFLLNLTDALRLIQDPFEIQATTAMMVGEHLGADRAMYGEVQGDPGSERGTIRGHYVRGGGEKDAQAPFPEHFTFAQFGEHTMAARYRGEPLIVADVQTDPGYSAEERAAWAEFGVRAAVVATLAKGGRLVAEFGVHSTSAREWTEAEIRLIQESAERTWAAAERARAETALRQSEENYRSLFETMGQGFCELELVRDANGRAVDQLYLQLNPAFERLFGIPITEAQGRKASDLFPDLDPVWTGTLARVAETGRPERIEHEFGGGRWFEVNAHRAEGDRLTVLFDDVSERKRAELALRESEEKYAALFAASPAPCLTLRPDAPHFTIADVNDAYLAATMRTREKLVGRPMFDAFPDNPDDPAATGVSNLRAALERALASGRFELMDVQKYDIVRPDGTFEERWWKPANAPVVDANGKVLAIIHHVADVTVEQRAVEALRESHAHQQILLAELQHRVRNTLAVVRSIARRTAENSNSVEGMLSHFRGRLDAFSRVQTALTRGVSGTVSLITLIEDELVAHAAREGEQVSIEGPEIMLEVKTAERLSLAIHELTTNAVKHGALTSDKGRIRISWKREQATGSARLLLNWKESGVEVKENPEREGFGMELLLRSLPYDVQGETKVALYRHGLEFDLSMPLREPVEIK